MIEVSGKDFLKLATTGLASDGDYQPKVALSAIWDSGLMAYSQGAYSRATRLIPMDIGETLEVALPAKALLNTAKLYATAEKVKLNFKDGKFVVSSGRKRNTLPTIPWDGAFAEADGGQNAFAVSVSLADIRREVRDASYVVAKTMTTPILSGLRVVAGKGRLGFEASNGYSVSYQSTIPAEPGEGDFDVVVGAADLRKALSLLDDDRVGVYREHNRIVLCTETTRAEISLMGDGSLWPRMRYPSASAAQWVEIPVSTLKSLLRAFAAHSAMSATIYPEWGETMIATDDTGSGVYQEGIEGHVVSPYRFGIAEITALANVARGDSIRFTLEGQTALANLGEGRRAHIILQWIP